MLKIIRSDEPITVGPLVICIYGPPGAGKTSLGYSASKPLLLDFDRGAHRAVSRKDTVQIESWADLESMTQTDLEGYDTIVVDTVGRALDYLSTYIVSKNPKLGTAAGGLTLQGYGELKNRFSAWVKTIRSYGLDLVMVAHSDEQHKGDDLIERIDAQGSSKNEIYKVSDLMARLKVEPGSQMPVLTFSPSDTSFGKDPAGFGKLQVPDLTSGKPFLGSLLDKARDHMNAMSEEQKARESKIAEWADAAEDATSVDEINQLVADTSKADKSIQAQAKRAVADRAKELGFVFVKGAGYSEQEKAAE